MLRKYWWVFPILLILLIYVLGDPILTRITRNALNSSLEKAFEGKSFQSQFEDVEVSLIHGSFQLKNLHVRRTSDPAIPEGLLEFRIKNTELRGFSAWNILVNNQLQLKDIKISDIDLLLGRSSSNSNEGDSLESFIPDRIEFMGLEALTLEDAEAERVRLRRIKENADTVLVYLGKSVSLSGLHLDSEGNSQLLRPQLDGIKIRLKDQKFAIANGAYLVQYDSLELSTRSNSLNVHGIQIAPEVDKFELADSYSVRKDVYDLKLPELKVLGFKFGRFVEKAVLEADSILLREPELAIYISTRLEIDVEKEAVFPQKGVKSSPLLLEIRSLGIKDGFLVYKELHGPSESNFDLRISLDSLQAGPFYTKALERGVEAITLNTSGIFLEDLPYQVALKFPYETEDTFSFDGSIGSFNMTHLNSLLVPLEAIAIQSGICNGIEFNSICSVSGCSGNFAMRYDDLKIDLLDKNRQEKKGIKSFFANIIIRQNNPVGNNLKTVPMEIERQPHLSFINLLDKSLVTGMRQTIKPF